MGDSSDSEEFYDAEEFTPIKGSKRSSLCKNINVTESGDAPNKDKGPDLKTDSTLPAFSGSQSSTAPTEVTSVEDDRTTVKSVVQGRRRFQELRRCMQTEEEDEGVPDATGSVDQQTFTLEHPFKIIAHDTMSLQSMTSLGRIGRILSGASESHSNIRDTAPVPSVSSREPSTISDEQLAAESRTQNVLAMAEPDVIASTKANSLKHNRGAGAIVTVSGSAAPDPPHSSHPPHSTHSPHPPHPPGPVAPPRKKKRNRLHGSQSLSTTDGDNLSVCTTDTDEYRYIARRPDKPQLDSLLVEPPPPGAVNQSMALPSPASTIESLTREFQDSLELSQSKYASDRSSLSIHESRSSGRASESSRSSTAASARHKPADTHADAALLLKQKAEECPGREDERSVRTHSEGRSTTAQRPNAARRSKSESVGGGAARRRSAGDEQLGLALRTRTTSGHQLTDIEILEQVTVLNLDTGQLARVARRSKSESVGGGAARRRSAGDEQLGLALRTRTTSGHQLTDIEILEQVTVLNLDTGQLARVARRSKSESVGGGAARRRSAGDEQLGLALRTRTTSGHQLTDIEILEQVTVLNLDTGQLARVARRSKSESVGGGAARRRSAGDEQLGLALRTRTTSGHQLTDIEILEQVTVLNLDTGERVPLSVAEHKLPQCINPLSLHIMRLTSEYIGRANDDDNARDDGRRRLSWRRRLNISTLNLTWKSDHSSNLSLGTRETDEESESVCAGGAEDEAKEMKRESTDRQTTGIKRKTEKLKRFFGSTVKKTVDAAKSLAQEVSHARHKEDVADIADDVRGEHNIKLKASNSHKGPYDFDGCVRHVQEMGSAHLGAVWCCKFSVCGRLLATAGQDKLLRLWVTRDAYHMFQEMRTKYNLEQKVSPSASAESLGIAPPPPPGPSAPFCPEPFCVYSGHSSDLLDVSWSKNYFILSSSMDKTVRLWHTSRGECLCCFQHIDFVTAIVFHPRDDRYFLSGSLDGKLRLWNIPDKKVAVWNEVDGKTKLITAANFCQNGKFAVVGTYDGRCIFYTTDQLKYHTQIDVRSTRGKNSTGRKISGIEPMPNDDKILVTSNDSRIRLYDLRDLNLSCKYKGYVNVSSQIKASFSHDGKYIVSGSENQCIYIWKTYHDYSKFTSVRRDRNDFWEGIKAHNAVVTCAVFAPNPDHMIRMINEREEEAKLANNEADEKEEVKGAEGGMVASSQTGHVLVSADFNGCIKVFVHKAKPKHSSLPASALA